ncbi:MAG: 1-deoxy-D-xylulose-5-phosphate reductoisomerase [Chitinophagaceae bacterium]|nr:1-deoxy-D-xylulose-5-phosphate reductoisomerase [Chitinophagaceae bacterium]MCW5904921.1 1-deoxy-D-xylulose-5-phosphate reductoisomerase [Chitinophagaceae bacterium]
MSIKRIGIFGSTGSIGTQTLEVVSANAELFSVTILTAQNNHELLIQQALKFLPKVVVIGDDKKYTLVKEALATTSIQVMAGETAIEEAAAMIDCYDIMLMAIIGYAGLKPILKAIEIGKPIALANKETLVVAGEIVMQKVVEKRIPIIPIDCEHSAIFQCLIGEGKNKIEKIILTATGGPFRGRKPNYLVNVKKDHALQHPVWSMGTKVTIDSATLMNKGLQMIETKWLFNLKPEQIQVVIHPQGIIHSMVVFEDGNMKAQMSSPNMKLPIQYALTFPQRIVNNYPRYDFKRPDTLTFEEPDTKTFRNLTLATEALHKGGNMPCILNAANEIAVFAFLRNRVGFLDMIEMVERTIHKIPFIAKPTLEDLFVSDGEARNFAASLVDM